MPERQTACHIIFFKKADPAHQISRRRALIPIRVLIDNNLAGCNVHAVSLGIFLGQIFFLQAAVMAVFRVKCIELPGRQIMPGDDIRHTVVLHAETDIPIHYIIIVSGQVQTGKSGF